MSIDVNDIDIEGLLVNARGIVAECCGWTSQSILDSFNQLDLPEYASKEQLRERLMLAIHEGSEGFGFA